MNLSPREQQIVALVSMGKRNSEIGRELDLETNTVKNYMSRILKKLHLRNRTELAMMTTDQAAPPMSNGAA